MNKLIIGSLVVFLLTSQASAAQEAPVPHRSPRVPVKQQLIATHHDVVAQTHEVQGQATIIDGEKLRIGDVDLRLFGVVPPQLSASFGPQARTALDTLVSNQNVDCQVHDRDHDGRFLATCKTASGADLALELLRHGLAVSARGSLSSSDLAATYIAAEQAAQAQKIGLWSVVIPAPANAAPMQAVALPVPPAPAQIAATTETKKDEKTAKAEKAPVIAPVAASDLQIPSDNTVSDDSSTGFFVRYQLLLTGLVMLVTALGILLVLSLQRRAEKRDEMKAIAAALRGELMAARTVCQTRLKTITTEADDKSTTWPRIRTTLYQAYVGRLGWLGAELARQIASIYGQTSDYAAYYNDETRSMMPKRQALETLIGYIEEVLPKLAAIEQTGQRPASAQPKPMTTLTPTKSYAPSAATEAPPATIAKAVVEAAPAITTPPAATVAPVENVKTTPTPATEPVAATTPAAVEAPIAVAPAAEETPAPSPIPLWNKMRKFARERLAEKHEETPDDFSVDYTLMIEEEMASLSFTDSSEETTPLHTDTTKLRDAG